MSGYENVARLKTNSRLRSPSSARTRSKQRKWRVLLSIGLLLPTLAAIIGIVAWTISVEVAHGASSSDSNSANHLRRPHHSHLQQPQQLTPVAAAYQQLKAAKRQQQAAAEPELVDARGVRPVAAAVQAAKEPRKRVQKQQQQQQQHVLPADQKQQPELNRQTKSESDSSTLLLTNLDQALSGSAAAEVAATISEPKAKTTTTTTTTTTSSVADDENADDAERPIKELALKQLSAGGQSTRKSSSQSVSAGESEAGVGAGAESAAGEAPQWKPAREDHSSGAPAAGAKSLRHKSRKLNDDASASADKRRKQPRTRSKRPITSYEQQDGDEDADSVAATTTSAPPADELDGEQVNEGVSGRRAGRSGQQFAETPRDASNVELQELDDVNNKRQTMQTEDDADDNNNSSHDLASNGGRWRKITGPTSGNKRHRESRLIKESDAASALSGAGRLSNRYIIVDRESDERQASSGSKDDDDDEPAATVSRTGDDDNDKSAAERQRKSRLQKAAEDDELSFEAIASAISTTLSASSPRPEAAAAAEGDPGVISALQTDALGDDEPAYSVESRRQQTTGEHVAEVIDHIVERRKQASGSGQFAGVQRGPQIVVVAPVSASMKARSLTKAPGESGKSDLGKASAAKKSVAVAEDKRISASMKKEALEVSGQQQQQQEKSKKKPMRRTHKPLGARLMGDATKSSKQDGKEAKYSERVEVIEDDDSSALLFKSMPELSDISREDKSTRADAEQPEAATNDRDAVDKSLLALDLHDPSSIHAAAEPGAARHRSVRHEVPASMAFERYARTEPAAGSQQQPKLYSAERLIRDHVLKAKLRPKASEVDEIKRSGSSQHQVYQQQNTNTNHHSQQAKVAPTTIRPHITTSTSTEAASSQSQIDEIRLDSNRQQQQQQPSAKQPATRTSEGVQSVRVPVLFSHSHQRQQQAAKPQQIDQTYQMESQTNYVQAHSPSQQQQFTPDQQQNPTHQLAGQSHLQQPQAAAPAQYPQQQHQQEALPVFADQEYNVPAHMAESVIQEIHRATPTIGMFNGQPRIVNAMSQVPSYHPHPQMQHQHQQQPQMYYQQPQQQDARGLMGSASQQRAVYLQQQQQVWNQLMDRHQLLRQRQVLANRESGGSEQVGAGSSATKAPRGVIHPMAQMALRHLISSLGQQAATQQAAADKEAQAARGAGPSRSSAALHAQQQAQDPIQAAGSSPVASSVPAAMAAELPASGSSRSMRSLPIGAAAPGSQQQLISDQEVQESYGQMPTYHMGGGGGHGQHYGGGGGSQEKSKGITFHFGGGPIGGGTQLITSPMGIFKHLMIPLLPNPRVNLNGKVVFGVVLEKTTAFGEPKKKYKFWG